MTSAATFALVLTQGGSNITADLTMDGVRVHAKVKAARTCAYAYTIAGDGAVDITALVGATVVVTVNTGGGAETIFSGRINRTPQYDTNTRTVSITATDGWQAFVNGKTLAELEALITNGTYREDLDGPRVSGLQQALALLSTTPEDAYIDRDGDFTVTSWTPKASGSEDGTVGAGDVRDVVPQLADADELVNTVAVTYQHTFTRRVWNKVSFSWTGVAGNWCDWYTGLPSAGQKYDLPTIEEVSRVADGTGWAVLGSISMDGHPEENFGPGTGLFPCGGDYGWVLAGPLRYEVTGFSWSAGKTFSVEARETLTLTLTAASSVSAYGSRPGELSFAADTPYAADAVDADESPAEPDGFTSYGSGSTQSYSEEIDTTQRSANVAAALDKARLQILETHRRNTVTWTQLIAPTLDLGQTWTITHPLSTCRGVVTELRHMITRTAALTMPTVSAYIGGGGSDDARTAPALIATPPSVSAPSAVSVGTKVGNTTSSDDFDEAWTEGNYWVTNAPPWICSPPACPTDEQIYDTGLYIAGPEITDAARAAVELTDTGSYAVAIPTTTITVSGG